MWWKLKLFAAKYFGLWKYYGLFSNIPKRYPKARVQYSNNEISHNMAIGNAVEYAEMFGGQVIK